MRRDGDAGPPSPPAAAPPPLKRLKVTFGAGDRRGPQTGAADGSCEVLSRAEPLHGHRTASTEGLNKTDSSSAFVEKGTLGWGITLDSAQMHRPARDEPSQHRAAPARGSEQRRMSDTGDIERGQPRSPQGQNLPRSTQRPMGFSVEPANHRAACQGSSQAPAAHIAGHERAGARPLSPPRAPAIAEMSHHSMAARGGFEQHVVERGGHNSAPPSPLRAFASLDLPTEELDDALQLQLLTPTLAAGVCTPLLYQARRWLLTPQQHRQLTIASANTYVRIRPEFFTHGIL